ncbi:MAG: response regulator [Deltaproteobacteria bacterium]|nr:response regulator [Deltaproteobacteria bacterium]
MASPVGLEPDAAVWVVLVLSTDTRFAETLAVELARRGPGFEIHIVRDVAKLQDHLRRVNPDAVVLEVDGLSTEEREQLRRRWRRAWIPTLLVTAADPEPTAWLGVDAGPVDVLRRDDGHEPLCRLLLQTREYVDATGRLQETVRHYSDLLDAMGDGIFVLCRGVFCEVNAAFAAALGCNRAELVGRARLTDFLPDQDRLVIAERLARVEVGGGERELIEIALVTRDQSRRQYELVCRASVVGGRRAVVGVARDVTAMRDRQDEIDRARQRAAQIERLRALGELAAGVAHDFNNVLETVLGRVQLAIEKRRRGVECTDDLLVIEGAAKTAAQTVRRIHEFARPSGMDSWHDVDLVAVAKDAVEYVRAQVPPRIALHVDVQPLPRVRGNGAELREVMLNLLANAVDAIDGDGEVHVRAKTERGRAVLEVEDTGCGMTPAVQRRIFEPFFSTKAEAGTGLGLSVSHGILRRHDAEIQISSVPGKGTLFRLVFQGIEHRALTPPAAVQETLRVAVLDDDTTVAELMRDLLKELGHEVVIVNDVKSLLYAVGERGLDLVITDLDLPELSGWQVARHVRQVRPTTRVGLVTGWPLAVTHDELKARGVDFVLAKPFSIDSLTRALTLTG